MPKDKMGLSKVKYFDPKYVLKIAQQHVTLFHKRVFADGEDKNGRQFEKYSPGYEEAIKRDYTYKRGSKKGKHWDSLEGQSTVSGANKISKRFPRFTGKTAMAFRASGNKGVIAHKKDYYEIGWDESEAATIALRLSKMEPKRDFVSGIPDKEFETILKLYGITAEKEWKKLKNVTVVVGK